MAAKDRQAVHRIVDANLNRAMEAVRVCEDVIRFRGKRPSLTRKLRAVRHGLGEVLKSLPQREIVLARDSRKDIGRTFKTGLNRRRGLDEVFTANIRRACESLRVLEEVLKIGYAPLSEKVMDLRYAVYSIERDYIKKEGR